RRFKTSEQPFALRLLARQLARPADRLRPLARPLLGRLLVMLPELHLAENALALHLLLEGAERLIDIVVTDKYLHVCHHPFRASGCGDRNHIMARALTVQRRRNANRQESGTRWGGSD